ncbi:hypothetical protein K431DRAFT_302015 [Polychaeton citri CBS 116435]|uniref:Transferase n=1 Tax=Polychaeton citri CBS 116435 TaxID=1314669 RepID=A0A9P4QDZ3_9PEZI|nr:hypothetical protein K431DRAFT_302015 [Polychaeton citri CBS 116435]
MGSNEVYQIRPSGYPNLPEEICRLSTNDYLPDPIVFVPICLYFEVCDAKRKATVELLRAGLEETLGQCRHLAGTIEKTENSDYYILSKKESTVTFNINWLTDRAHGPQFPSFEDLKASDFTTSKLGDITRLTLHEMDPSSGVANPSPDKSPPVLGIQANLISGGIALVIHVHHWAMDFGGIANFVHQWADNALSVANGNRLPTLNPLCLDRTRLNSQSIIAHDAQVKSDAGVPPGKPTFFPISVCLFHLAKSKAEELKRLASTADGQRISSYDASVALWWRLLTRHRVKTYKVDSNSVAAFSELVGVRNRLVPSLPERYFGNAIVPVSAESQQEKLSLKDVGEDAPLSRIAAYIRSVTDSVDPTYIYKFFDQIERRRRAGTSNKPKFGTMPPFKTTDWRLPNILTANFGFGKPTAFRHMFGVTPSLTIYPPRHRDIDGEEVFEFAVPIERVALDGLLQDYDLKHWFEYRGFDVKV